VHPPQLGPEDEPASDEARFDPPPVAKTENAFVHVRPPHDGHFTSSSADERTSSSKRVLHAAQSYS
jgi:hypothetical protein